MSVPFVFALAGAALFVIAFYGVFMHAHLLRKIMALNFMGSGVFLVIGGLARRTSGVLADPVPQALVITGIVVAVAATAFLIVLMLQVQTVTGRPELPSSDQD